MCYSSLVLKKGIKVVKEKKGDLFITFFIDLEGRVSFAYLPVRDQNLVVRGKNWRLIGGVFYISFEKGFKMKSQMANKLVCVF